jgi:rRNA maturation protein Nop10
MTMNTLDILMVERLICPDCGGKGVLSVLFQIALKEMECPSCKGIGRVTLDHLARIELGKKFRKYRVEICGLGLREAASLWGMKASELSYIEQGKTVTDWTPPGWGNNDAGTT